MAMFEVQPAHKIYAFDRGWRIMKYVTETLFKRTDVAARWWFTKAKDAFARSKTQGAFVKYWLYVYMVGLYMAGAAQYLTAMLFAGLFLAIQTILLSLWVGFSIIMIGILTACTFTYSRFYRIFYRCPDCHKEMSIPTFICPNCSERHTRLWPSIYGVVSHRCIKCNTKLPTLRLDVPGTKLMKRDSLVRICPNCSTQINAGIGTGTNIHFPIVGGPSTGKSNLIVMATKEFKQLYEDEHHYSIAFTDSKHELDYNENVRRLSTGHELVKTTEIVAHAYNLKIQSPKARVPKLAYIYDAAGEAYNRSEYTSQQEYYKFIDGIIFVIDPFSIPAYRSTHAQAIQYYQNLIRPSELDVMQAYERMFNMFEDSAGLHKGRRFPHPIAIVVTKVDALNLEYEIGSVAAQSVMNANPSITSEGDAINMLVRNFLAQNDLDHFVRDIELQFSNVRYFSCSALGRLPVAGDNRAFMPIRVADPLIWLLSRAKAIEPVQENGRATRILGPQTQVQTMPFQRN
jgi:hypothetical protein